MRHIIWRNRASAILGLLVMLIPLTGFPETIRDSLIILLGFLIAVFGFSRNSVGNYSYGKNEGSEKENKKDDRIEEVSNIGLAKKKHHRKNFVKNNQEKTEQELKPITESQTETDSEIDSDQLEPSF